MWTTERGPSAGKGEVESRGKRRERDLWYLQGLVVCIFNVHMLPRVISTLCPKRLQPSDYIDLSGLLQPKLTLPCGTMVFSKGFTHHHDNEVPFPPNTRGFLYYHTPPKAPPFVGELRFRCANSLEDFPNGKDLLSTDKFNPWSIPLSSLANKTTYLTLRAQLMMDGLTSQTTL